MNMNQLLITNEVNVENETTAVNWKIYDNCIWMIIWQQGSTEKREMWLMKYDWCNMTDTMTVIERMNVKRVIIEMKEYNNYE